MKITVRDYQYQGEQLKNLNIENVNYTNDTSALLGIKRMLAAAKVVWPTELGRYSITQTPEPKKKKP